MTPAIAGHFMRYGEYPHRQLHPAARARPDANSRQIGLDRRLADFQDLRDLLVGLIAENQLDDSGLSRRESHFGDDGHPMMRIQGERRDCFDNSLGDFCAWTVHGGPYENGVGSDFPPIK
jgi:hypothetical protein